MKFSQLILALIPLAIASPILEFEEAASFDIEARGDNAAAVIADINTAGSDTSKFKATLDSTSKTGKIPPSKLITLQQENQNIINAIKAATSSAKSSTPFTQAESKKGYNAVVALEPITFNTLSDVVSHKASFKATGVLSTVITDLKNQKAAVAALGSALQAKVSAPYKQQAPALEAKYASHFQSAINSLSS